MRKKLLGYENASVLRTTCPPEQKNGILIEKQTIFCGCGGPLAFGATRGRTCI
jgi:hypothetical protein